MGQSQHTAVRTEPRLWVETLWILKSLEAAEPIREVQLTRGLNLILSPPTDGSMGHGVGKTAFSQLLRFALEDPQWAAGSPLRDELLSALPDGAVAMRVHIGGKAWTVLKPWKHQKQYRAATEATWQQLARNEVANQHSSYLEALDNELVRVLPVPRLPGSNQPIQWHHVLAWCSRDQGSRYQSYYHWRVEGTGFTLPALSPALVVRIVLGLLKDISTLEKLRGQEESLRKAEVDLANTQRRPADLLAHVKHQLANILNAPQDSPFRATTLFDEASLVNLAKQRRAGYDDELRQAKDEQERLESKRTRLLEQRGPLTQRVALLKNHIAQLNAAISGNVEEVERLRNVPEALQQRLPQFCEPGNRLFRDCSYVTDRIRTLSFETAQNVAQRQRWVEGLKAQLAEQQGRLREWESELAPVDRELSESKAAIGATSKKQVQALADQRRLDEALADYEHYERIVAGTAAWQELVAKEASVEQLKRDVDSSRTKVERERDAFAKRRKAINELMEMIAKRLPGFIWGTFDDAKTPPFHMGPMHSTTFGVLDTLAGDIACLMDSSNAESLHPGFLLHDSPREAEMSEPILWALLSVVRDQANPPFQYIVTTSTAGVNKFRDNVRLTLDSKSDDGYLLRRRIGLESKPLGI